MARKEKAPKTGLTTKHWFGYMFGDWGGCMTFTLMASIFGLYCTNVLGINPTLMGTLTLIWTIRDAICATSQRRAIPTAPAIPNGSPPATAAS